MKYTFTKGLFVAAIATLFAACSTDDAADQAPVAPGKIEVSLNAALPESRAQINVDETNGRFTGAWEATDIMTVLAKGSASGEEAAQFTYDASSKVFKGQLTDAKQDWTYQAVYPYVAAAGVEHKIPFGAARTQNGSNFNGDYDPLVSAPVTHQASEPGKTPQGEAVTFGLNRLTAILAVTFTTDDASVKSEKVKTVVLTAADGKMIAAKTFDIDKSALSGALGADEQSDAITLSYEEGSEPTAESFKAYFNVPAANYGKLTATITTEGHTATLDLSNGVELTAGELAYGTKAVTGWTASGPAAPTLEWVDNPDFEKQEIKEGMSVLVNLQAAAGIEGFVIKIDSKGLATVLGQMEMPVEGTVTTMDMVNNPNTAIIKEMIPGFPNPLAGHTEAFQLDLSNLVPMILALPEMGIPAEDIYGDHKFTLTMSDALGKSVEKTLVFYVTAPAAPTAAISGINLWTNEATATLTNVPAEATFQYKRSTETDWQNATKNEDGTFKIAPTWSKEQNAASLDYYTVNRNTGVFAGATYDWQILSQSIAIASGTFKTEAGDVIPDGNMANSSLICFTPDNSAATFWASGSFNMISTYQLCKQETFDNRTTAHLVPATVLGSVLAAGSLMVGQFQYASFAGTARFGQSYSYKARPTAMKVKFHATIGDIDKEGNSHPDQLKKNEKDKARIFVCITDWSGRHAVKAGASSVDGAWDPEKQSSVAEGNIIGYGSYWITESTADTGLVEISIPIYYYDNVTQPSKTYTIAISCASSAYGDYKNGSTKSDLYVTDFEWVY